MRRRRRALLDNPDANRILAMAAAALAGAAGFVAAWLRAVLERGTTAHSAASFLIVLALLCVGAAGLFEGRYGDTLGEYLPAQVRRGGLLRVLLGVSAALAGCVLATVLNDDEHPAILIAAANGVLYTGLAMLLGGVARLAMSDGARHAGRKVQERLDDEF
jgi:MFS family permease